MGWVIASSIRAAMNKLSRKLFVHIALILVVVFGLSYCVNTFFMPNYFIYQKRASLTEAVEKLRSIEPKQLLEETERIADEYQLTIIHTPYDHDIDRLNWTLREQFTRERIAMSKFWLTEDSVAQLMRGGTVTKTYQQEKLKSSVIVIFVLKEGLIFAAGESVANSGDTIRIVNQFNLLIAVGALLLAIVLAAWFSKRTVRPLEQLKITAEEIAELTFQKVDIRTGDEIEELAHSINSMSTKLEQAHTELEERNRNLRVFIRDISHELKTPLAVIKAYAAGMKDGLDDGTYADIIEKQTDNMSELITKLLEWSRLQAEQLDIESVPIIPLLERIISAFELPLKQHSLELTVKHKDAERCCVKADKLKLEMAITNLISNAVKYTTNGKIEIELVTSQIELMLFIRNGCELSMTEAELKQLWEPFFVAESSRSKQFSGTGLGLSIVHGILQKHEAKFGTRLQQGVIEFHFALPLCPQER
ncbi:histidine kinase dimerization/phospho-acceptor domain-containing protein [Paenibacillus alvei]|uniref:histidine kinase dimerization/phospho-acceptor domain-containing protein n=2 Tax=Paenibacillus alvei TaxID=44250 RepID=UPI0018CEE52A